MLNKRKLIFKRIILPISLIFFVFVMFWYDPFYLQDAKSEKNITNIRLFKSADNWPLAVAVDRNEVDKIIHLGSRYPEWINQKDNVLGITLLFWAITNERYKSAEALLKTGADPNIRMMRMGGQTALFDASCYSSVDSDNKKDPKFVNLLLKYGADPNIYYLGKDDVFEKTSYRSVGFDTVQTFTEEGYSPLMKSVGCGIEKTKALVEAGSDVNHKTVSGETAAIRALTTGNVTTDRLQYAKYLIVHQKAKIISPYFTKKEFGDVEKNYPVELLRDFWIYDLDSEKYKIKTEIIEEFKNQGVDYWSTPISEGTLKNIKKWYPDTWQEYIKKY